MERRVTQRRPQACRTCTRLKKRCDKGMPCSRCVLLGIDCEREQVQLRKLVHKNSAEISFLNSLKDDLISQRLTRVPDIVDSLIARLATLQEHEIRPESHTLLNTQQLTTNKRPDLLPTPQQLPQPLNVSDHSSFTMTALEHLAWGRSYGNCYPHRGCICDHHKEWAENSPLSFSSPQLPARILSQLPSIEDAERLVTFHQENLAWHHNCLHQPTFWEQCRVFWTTGQCNHPQWVALYCSILSASLNCMLHTGKAMDDAQLYESSVTPQNLLSAMVDILYACDFLQNITIYSVQAIVISTEAAHNCGLSQMNATLFGAAIRVSQCLGLHKIQEEPAGELQDWPERIEREVGRRVWCQMIIQDHFAISFTDTCGISPSQYFSSPPTNAHDHDLVSKPDQVLTVNTYNRVLLPIAELMPELEIGLGSLKKRKSIQEQYECVLRIDHRMRQLVGEIPKYFLHEDRELESITPWLCAARRSLAITAAEKIIMIHRPFVWRSFHTPTYAHTRRTCVSAAMTILREHETIIQTGEISLWTHTAFCITAVVILVFEITSHGDNLATDVTVYKKAVSDARLRLSQRSDDVLARRGVSLIDTMVPNLSPSMAPKQLSSGHGLSFSAISAQLPGDWACPDLNILGSKESLFENIDRQEHTLDNWSPGIEEDFDVWFKDVFNSDFF